MERKIYTNYKLQQDNVKLLNSLLSTTKFSSIDEITEPSTKVSSINEFQKSTIKKVKTTINHAMSYPPTVEMKNLHVEQGETNKNVLDLDLTKLATIIASDVVTANPITILRLSPFTPLDIKSYLHSIIIQLTYTTYFLSLLNSSQSFVSLSNAHRTHTVDTALYTQLSKGIPNLTMKIPNPESTFKIGVEILLLLQTKTSMSKSHNDVDTLYKSWCNISKGANESVEDYIARVVQF